MENNPQESAQDFEATQTVVPSYKAVSDSSWIKNWRERLFTFKAEFAWFAMGFALIGISSFDGRHGLALNPLLGRTGLNIGFLALAVGAILSLLRRPGDEQLPQGGDILYRVGFGIFVVGILTQLSCHLAGSFSFITFGGIFLGDLLAFAGPAVMVGAKLRERREFPLAIGSAGFVLGTLLTLVSHYLLKSTGLKVQALPSSSGASGWILVLATILILAGIGFIIYGAVKKAPKLPQTTKPNYKPGFLVVAVAGLIFLPFISSYGLMDPWETHYSEVARQMIAREDWISLYWENNWFWSKPVGTFWLVALSFELFGFLDKIPGITILLSLAAVVGVYYLVAMIGNRRLAFKVALAVAAVAIVFIVLGYDVNSIARVSDIAARLPNALLSIFGAYIVYFTCSKLFSRQAGVLAALALVSISQYILLGRQVMTDAPFMILMFSGICFMALALFSGKEEDQERRPLTIMFFILFILATFPQYSLMLVELRRYGPLHALGYTLPWLVLFMFLRRARRARDIYCYAFYLCIGLATIMKGLLGLGIPGALLLVYLLVSGDWRRLRKLHIPEGVVIYLLTMLPWFLAMYVRHGKPWFNELIIHHHFKRVSVGVHGDKGGFEYFVQWGAYALYPWVALIPAALIGFWNKGRDLILNRRGGAKTYFLIYVALVFTLFSLGTTKFHHYIYPLMPGLAIIIGIWMDRVLKGKIELNVAALFIGICIMAIMTHDIVKSPNIFVNTFIYNYQRPWPTVFSPEGTYVLFAIVSSFVLLSSAWKKWRDVNAFWIFMVVTGFIGGAVLFVTMGKATWIKILAPAFCIGLGLLAVWLLMKYRDSWKPTLIIWATILIGITTLVLVMQNTSVSPKLLSLEQKTVASHVRTLSSAMPTPNTAVTLAIASGARNEMSYGILGKFHRLLDIGYLWIFLALAFMMAANLIIPRDRRKGLLFFILVALGIGIYQSHVYLVNIGPHWSQKHIFDSYYRLRKDATEEIAAYMMNWRGETWYSRNEVHPIKSDSLIARFARKPGRRFIVTERNRVRALKSLLNKRFMVCKKVEEWDILSNKYSLTIVQDDPNDPEVAFCLKRRAARGGR